MAIDIKIEKWILCGDSANFTVCELSPQGKILAKKTHYYKHLPDALNYLAQCLAHYKRQVTTVEELKDMVEALRTHEHRVKEIAVEACKQVLTSWGNTIIERMTT